MPRLRIVGAIFPWLVGLGVVSLILLLWLPILGLASLALLIFLAFFFRDPERQIQAQPDIILSPADGSVVQVMGVEDAAFLNQPAWRVGIFLSLLDVHLNRSPIDGRVVRIRYKKGKFHPAFASSAPTENEHNLIGIEG